MEVPYAPGVRRESVGGPRRGPTSNRASNINRQDLRIHLEPDAGAGRPVDAPAVRELGD